MLINGQVITSKAHMSELLKTLPKLPSKVESKGMEEFLEPAWDDQFHGILMGAADHPDSVLEALANLLTGKEPDSLEAGMVERGRAIVHLIHENLDAAIEHSRNASEILRKQNVPSLRVAALSTEFFANIKLYRKTQNTDYLEAARLLGVEIAERSKTDSPVKIDTEALHVDEGEVGYTTHRKAGSFNINECLLVTIKNPDTGKVAVLHLNKKTKISSLDDVFKHLGADDSIMFEVKILGARVHDQKDIFVDNAFEKDRQRANVEKLFKYMLNRKDVNITMAQILEENQPICVVLDPVSFELEESLPLSSRERAMLTLGANQMRDENQPFHVAFDTDVSDGYLPLSVRKHIPIFPPMAELDNFTLEQAYNFTRAEQQDPFSHIAIIVATGMHHYITEHRKAAEPLISAAHDKLARLEAEGLPLIPNCPRKATLALRQASIFVGEGSATANAPALDYIEKEMVKTREGNGASYNFSGLATLGSVTGRNLA